MRCTMNWIQKLVFLSTLATLFGLAALTLKALGQEYETPTDTAEASAEDGPTDFGNQVRNLYFKAIQGDAEAYTKVMELLEGKLAEEPDHPEALVYHGSLQLALSGNAFQKGDVERGQSLWTQGLQEMDRAVEVAPDRLDIRIPRGATLLFVSRDAPPAQAPGLLERSVEDYGTAYEMQKDDLMMLSTHSRGELLLGLADGYQRLGEADKARALFEQAVETLPGTDYAQEAQTHLDADSIQPVRICFGCHHPEEDEEESVASK